MLPGLLSIEGTAFSCGKVTDLANDVAERAMAEAPVLTDILGEPAGTTAWSNPDRCLTGLRGARGCAASGCCSSMCALCELHIIASSTPGVSRSPFTFSIYDCIVRSFEWVVSDVLNDPAIAVRRGFWIGRVSRRLSDRNGSTSIMYTGSDTKFKGGVAWRG